MLHTWMALANGFWCKEKNLLIFHFVYSRSAMTICVAIGTGWNLLWHFFLFSDEKLFFVQVTTIVNHYFAYIEIY